MNQTKKIIGIIICIVMICCVMTKCYAEGKTVLDPNEAKSDISNYLNEKGCPSEKVQAALTKVQNWITNKQYTTISIDWKMNETTHCFVTIELKTPEEDKYSPSGYSFVYSIDYRTEITEPEPDPEPEPPEQIITGPTTIDTDKFKPSQLTEGDYGKAFELTGVIVNGLTTVGTIIAIVTIIVIGMKYIVGSVEEKAEYKKTMVPYIVGCILIFTITRIVSIIYSLVSQI